MKRPGSIFTLNARDNIILDVAFKNSLPVDIYHEINNIFEMFISSLVKNGIDYQSLKSCLIPREARKEITFVFDSEKIRSNYALLAISKLLPELDKNSSNSIIIGDYTGENRRKYELRNLFKESLIQINSTTYQYHNQYFLVYINNLSNEMVIKIIKALKQYDYFTGYFDVTYSSILKTYLSGILIPHFIRYKALIIIKDPHETSIIDEIEDNLNCDNKELGFNCKFINSTFYDIFLSYKIEREVLHGFENDTQFSLNIITDKIVDLNECEILIDKNKFDYLLSNKTDNLERAGITNRTIEELMELIKSKINSNYIYNLTFLENCRTLKFNILIETQRANSKSPMKLIVALEYRPVEKRLRLITMF